MARRYSDSQTILEQRIRQDCARLYDRYVRADRIMQARYAGWSHRTAMQETGGRKAGMIQAYADSIDPRALGIDPKNCRDKKSGRKRRHKKYHPTRPDYLDHG